MTNPRKTRRYQGLGKSNLPYYSSPDSQKRSSQHVSTSSAPLALVPQASPQTTTDPPPSSGDLGASKRDFETLIEEESTEEESKGAHTPAVFTAAKSTSKSSSEPVKKRQKHSRDYSSTGFSTPNDTEIDTEKIAVKDRDGWECWLCGFRNARSLQVAHNFPAADRQLFVSYRDNAGVFPPDLTYSASIHNLITLCPTCHGGYDSTPPKWVMLPTNLAYLIDKEETDYASRLAAARKGTTLSRTVPTGEEYASASNSNLYMPYFLDAVALPVGLHTSRFPRAYEGGPTTTILKATLGALQINNYWGSLCDSFPVGIPSSVMDELVKLIRLYNRKPPSIQDIRKSPGHKILGTDDDEEAEGDGSAGDQSQHGTREPKANGGSIEKGGASKNVAPMIQPKGKSPHTSAFYIQGDHSMTKRYNLRSQHPLIQAEEISVSQTQKGKNIVTNDVLANEKLVSNDLTSISACDSDDGRAYHPINWAWGPDHTSDMFVKDFAPRFGVGATGWS